MTMPKATKLTSTMILCLRNIRDHGFHAATGFHGMSERGGAVKSVDALRRRGLIDGPHRKEHLTEEGKRVLEEIEEAKAAERNAGMTNAVRRVLRESGFIQAGLVNPWGYDATAGKHLSVVHVNFIPDPDGSKRQGTLRFGNDQISEYVRVLQAKGYKVSRINGVTTVDRLMVMPK